MKNVSMRFCGYTFHHNPATLKIESTGNVRELISPTCEPQSAHLGRKPNRIIGEGELYGADCIARFEALQKLFYAGRKGLLSLPKMPAMYAYLKALTMTAEPKEDVLGYRFEFIEAIPPAKSAERRDVYETIVVGESLWDISYRFDVPIVTLIRLNPHIKYIDALDKGERVRLC